MLRKEVAVTLWLDGRRGPHTLSWRTPKEWLELVKWLGLSFDVAFYHKMVKTVQEAEQGSCKCS